MLISTAAILLFGMALGQLAKKLHLPSLIGYMLAGYLLGPYGLSVLDPSMLNISADIRRIALVIILMKAGLSLDLRDLKRVGRPAVLLCFVPASMEILGYLLFAPTLLGLTRIEAGVLGAVMGAVSPAVVVPRMTRLMEERRGTKKGIPQMIVTGASADDVYVIVLFTALTSLVAGGTVTAARFLDVPIAIVLGIAMGAVLGICVHFLFAHVSLSSMERLIVLLGLSMLLAWLENAVTLPFSGLLAVMAMCITCRERNVARAAENAEQLGKLWTVAEIFLFALVGAIVDVRLLSSAGLAMAVMLLIGLTFRLIGTWLSLQSKDLCRREKLFCALAEIPKATVQAAIGGIPLSMGLACGNTVLTFAALAITVTAPIGAFLIDLTAKRWLSDDR